MGRFHHFHLILFLLVATILMVQAMDCGSVNAEKNPQKLRLRGRALLEKEQKSIADPPSEKESEEAEAPEEEMEENKVHHSSSDKSAAGGGVIIGGLVTAIFAAVYCYIRVTRRRTRTTINDQIIV
ncbi:uncharacterized protein LOC111386977 [Olea europaea var. sylvestris]|uniref:Uncharacterized protein LOC111386977 n=1 Tax=Olea europaea subsp. europaea TaxID=158383 RepID=A0A8S0TNI4_OLEEU|nr:uncharacterized protein LOC111386977 [Olea europaea var. sylvestris]CAA3007484.1 uncharacterized protein LOC111386977 [Olea europaea subsp. europaea]